MKTLESKITDVTVFKGRAEVTRETTIKLEAGAHDLVFVDLPNEIDEDSIQVKGENGVKLSNISLKHIKGKVDEVEIQRLNGLMAEAKQKVAIAQEEVNRLEEDKNLLNSLLDKFTHRESKHSSAEIAPEKWTEMLEFYQQRSKKLDGLLRSANKTLTAEDDALGGLYRVYNNCNDERYKTTQQVELSIQTLQEGGVKLWLSYVVLNVNWTPNYEIRLDTKERIMHIVYRAVIKQDTSEVWNDVNLRISTAIPGLKGKHPDLKPWRIGKEGGASFGQSTGGERIVYRSLDELSMSEKDKLILEAQNMSEQLRAQEEAMRQNLEELMTTQQEMERQQQKLKGLQNDTWQEEEKLSEAEVKAEATSAVFDIKARHTIANNNEAHKVTITTADFPVGFRYSTVPKLSPYAYLKVKTKNTTAFPFLRGRAHIFLDNNFVANIKMLGVAPKEDFWTFFGVDQSLKIFHKFLRKYEKKTGNVFGKKMHTLTYEYEIEVKNHKHTAEEIIVWDQLPISGDEAVKVHLLQPNPKDKEVAIKFHQTDYHYIQWHTSLKPGATVTIPFSFAIEYPEGVEVEGL
ncbi:mucoidy inhibitor MuiA family protein [Microscilla marina]|uniref:Mucoidy inhibitor MuiA family protein n=1 Tax=Microscilla marina ATCC 23134 TaxID=313606 RepID=A1ZKJ9_MICM2|nr:mucoidy inhibitor MuiA family protein [Microscilla marina]EAY29225.1 conserved hypothetical protein [Microscilla marina ATCC 23134]